MDSLEAQHNMRSIIKKLVYLGQEKPGLIANKLFHELGVFCR
jgi:hypothetical protein